MKVSVLLDSSPWISDYSPHLSHPTGKNHCQLKYFDFVLFRQSGQECSEHKVAVLADPDVLRKKNKNLLWERGD